MRAHQSGHDLSGRIATIWNWWSESPFTFAAEEAPAACLSPVRRSANGESESFRPQLMPLR
jgi:hypothetical protein